ncbi:MAG: SDR family NAD(P)-dependent oxidoreductase [Ignavibacteriales bacterium]|nr:SDR family NAD(P)-dependent oxidoreductase [Ignavibacteriales bacterium]
MMKLEGKRVVITGGSKGLGRALASRFAEEGARLALCARSFDELNRLALELSLRGSQCIVSACDITDATQVSQFADLVLADFGAVDVLINNASLRGPRADILEWTRLTWDRVIDVNVNGLFSVTRAFLPSMVGQHAGSIINVSSSVGSVGKRRWGAYATSKFALEGFTQVLADEVRAAGIRVNSVDPGAMDTDMRHAAYPDEDRSKLKSPSEVTGVFVYLASDASRGTTGQCLNAEEFAKTHREFDSN